MTVVLTLLGSLLTSFLGSFLCFIIWVHFDFDARYEERKYRRHVDKAAEVERKMRAHDEMMESYGHHRSRREDLTGPS